MAKHDDTNLLPCPFCGAPAMSGSMLDDGFYVMCAHDECFGMVGYLQSESAAVTAWNRRATSPAADEQAIAAALKDMTP